MGYSRFSGDRVHLSGVLVLFVGAEKNGADPRFDPRFIGACGRHFFSLGDLGRETGAFWLFFSGAGFCGDWIDGFLTAVEFFAG